MTREQALLFAACAPGRDASATLAARADDAIDWPMFLALARRHRVQGLVYRSLTDAGIAVPGPSGLALAANARRIAHDNLLLAAETARLCRAMESRGCAVIALKGAPLAILAHGTLATKMAWDIDLLVDRGELADASAAMQESGYEWVRPTAARTLGQWHGRHKDSVWRHRANGAHVELHTALTTAPAFLLSGLDVHAPSRAVTLSAGHSVRTFAPAENFAYLSVHGAVSGWRRAKWLADVAALIERASDNDRDAWFAGSARLGAGRAMAQAFLLSARIFGTPVPLAATEAARSDWTVRLLTDWAARTIGDPDGYDGSDDTVFGTIPLHLMAALLVPGLRYKAASAGHLLADGAIGRGLGRLTRAR